ncbi:MAG TPA: HD domain-containing protein [Clostridiales bacterium]|nr:HD domain-containing protein [Clostridiales bacterium]
MDLITTLQLEMINYYCGDPKRIQHFMKVHSFAKLIGTCGQLDEHTLFLLEAAALVHDIGIKLCEEKYGDCNGKLQEKEGPALAKELLERLGFDQEVIERVCYLVGRHHTYSQIDGIDYQILVEADFLVNLYEDNLPQAACEAALNKIFKTNSGIALCRKMFL